MYTYAGMDKSAFHYVWWQVLHVAYIWFNKLENEHPSSHAPDIYQNLLKANRPDFQPFKNAFDNQWPTLGELERQHSEESVLRLLDIVSIVFQHSDNAVQH